MIFKSNGKTIKFIYFSQKNLFYKDHIFDYHILNKNLTNLIVYLHRVLKVLTSLSDYDLSLMIT